MITDEQLEVFGDRMAILYQSYEQDVISDIARRIKKTGRYTETAELMAQQLHEAGTSPAEIRSRVMSVLRADKSYQDEVAKNTLEWKQYVKEEIKAMEADALAEGNMIIAESGDMSFNYDLSMWEQAGKTLTKDSAIAKMIDEMSEVTNGTIKNLTNTMAFKGSYNMTAVQDLYVKSLDKAVLKMATGTFSFDQCVNDLVRELAQSGLRSVDYASGRTYQIDTAARMAIRTACSQLAGKISMRNCQSTGTDLVEVSAHWGAREDHAVWQGKIYSISGKNKKYPDFAVCRYGEVDGLKGINCRHDFYPFFEGISEPTEWPEEPSPKEWNGKSYTYTEATQKQRQMERNVRATKREIEAQNAIGGDTNVLEAKKRRQISEYHEFSNAMEIRPKDNRLKVVSKSSNLANTSSYKKYSTSIRYGNSKGYYASIPRDWKVMGYDNNALKNSNPKFRTEFGYDLNCPNCVCAYEMRKRGYDVVARPYVSGGSHYLNMHPESAWEGAVVIECSGKNDIIKLITEIDGDARFEIAYMKNRGGGHVILAEKENGIVHFLDVQSGQELDGNFLDKNNIISIKCFRIDILDISQRGITACEKGDLYGNKFI